MDKLRKAEEQGKDAARHAFEKAMTMGGDAERRIRQKMRIYPSHAAAATPSEVSQAQPAAANPELADARELEADPRTPIVSVNGEDVEGLEVPRKAGRTAA